MPCLKLYTNIPKSQIPVNFLQKLTPLFANLTQKEPERCICVVEADSMVSFGGNSTSPAAVASVESIGHVGRDENKVIVAGLTKFMEDEIGVKPDRFFLTFYDLLSYNVARYGFTRDENKPI